MKKFLNLTFFRKKGFSLVELMLSVGLVGILAAGTATVLKQQAVEVKRSEAAVDTTGVLNLVSHAIQSRTRTVCRDALTQDAAGNARTADPNTITINLADAQAANMIPAAQSNQNVQFVSLNLNDRRSEGIVSGPLSAQQRRVYSYRASVTFNLTGVLMQERGGITTITRQLPFPILVETDTADRILDCVNTPQFISDKSQEIFCESAGGDLDTSGINNTPSMINCVFNSRADGNQEPQTISGLSHLVETTNNWAGFDGVTQELVVRQGLRETSNDLAALNDFGNKPNRNLENVVGNLTVNSDVTVNYATGNEIENNSDAASRANFALTNCWMTTSSCVGTAPTSPGGTSQSQALPANPQGPVATTSCQGSTGLSVGSCSTSANCPVGEYPVAVSGGVDATTSTGNPTGGTSTFTGGGGTSLPKGSFVCKPLVEESECPRGQGAQLISSNDGSGRITVECASGAPPVNNLYTCGAGGAWTQTSTNCGGVTGACISGSANAGDTSCCGSSPSGTCSMGAGPCTNGAACTVNSDCGTGTCTNSGGGSCSGTYSITPPAGSCAPGNSGPFVSCFLENTLVTMADGQKKNIQDIQEGDLVRSLSPSSLLEGNPTSSSIVRKTMRSLNKGYKFGINWKQVNGRDVFVTGGHPFMTIDGSWKAFEPENAPVKERIELNLKKLDLGDILVREDGLEAIIAFHKEKTSEYVFNIEVMGTHEYIAEGYRVHNKVSCGSGFPCSGGAVCVNGSGSVITSGGGTCSRTCSTPGTVSSNTSWCGAGQEAYCGSDNNWHCRAAGSGGCGSGAPILADCSIQPSGATAFDCTNTHPNCSWAGAGDTCNCSGPATNDEYQCDASGSWVATANTNCGAESGACTSGSAVTGDLSCCGSTPAGTCTPPSGGPSCYGTYTQTTVTGGSCGGGNYNDPGTSGGGGCICGPVCGGFGMGLPVSCRDCTGGEQAQCSQSTEAACNASPGPCAWLSLGIGTGPSVRPCSDINNAPDGGYNIISGSMNPTRRQRCESFSPSCTWTETTVSETKHCSGHVYNFSTGAMEPPAAWQCSTRPGCTWGVDPASPPATDWITTVWSNCSASCGATGTQTRSVTCPAGYVCPFAQPAATRSCSGGTNCGGKVICGELFRQGYMSQAIILADNVYAAKNISEDVLGFYQAWAKPLVSLMQQSEIVTQIVKPYGVAWAEHMAYLEGSHDKDNFLGHSLHSIFLPVHEFMVEGKVTPRKEGLKVPEATFVEVVQLVALIVFVLLIIGLLMSPFAYLVFKKIKKEQLIVRCMKFNIIGILTCVISVLMT